MNPGDLYWVVLPGGAGHVQAGRRPAIVVQGALATGRLPTVLLVPLTTQLDALRFPGTVLIEPDGTNGLRRASVALVFQLSALDQRFVGHEMGVVAGETMDAIWAAFDELTERRPASGAE